jgi:hypothetical protein
MGDSLRGIMKFDVKRKYIFDNLYFEKNFRIRMIWGGIMRSEIFGVTISAINETLPKIFDCRLEIHGKKERIVRN